MTRIEDASASEVSEAVASAKLNLGLAVTARRPDGYHEIRSVFLRLDLADTLALSSGPGAGDELVITGDPDCPIADNLVLRAIAGFRGACAPVVVPPIRVVLTKRIPMAAGLGGGSTDAATTLRLLARRHPGSLSSAGMRDLATRIGSDVPFFLDGAGAALVSGLGEQVEPLPPPIEPLGVLLVRPPFGSSTPRVFGAWDESAARSAIDTARTASRGAAVQSAEDLAHLLRSGATPADLLGSVPALRDANDLWPPAVAITPALATLRQSLEEQLDRPVMMTGSGSTLFALYPDPDAAGQAAAGLHAQPGLQGAHVIATASTGPQPSAITSRRDT